MKRTPAAIILALSLLMLLSGCGASTKLSAGELSYLAAMDDLSRKISHAEDSITLAAKDHMPLAEIRQYCADLMAYADQAEAVKVPSTLSDIHKAFLSAVAHYRTAAKVTWEATDQATADQAASSMETVPAELAAGGAGLEKVGRMLTDWHLERGA